MSSGNKSKGRPTNRKRSVVSEAVIALRNKLGQTQQDFAHGLDVSITAVARWETNRPPQGVVLARFRDLARKHGQTDIAEVFEKEYAKEDERLLVEGQIHHAALTALYENCGPKWLEEQLTSLIKAARKGRKLSYPAIFDFDHNPSTSHQITYLESVLADLKKGDKK